MPKIDYGLDAPRMVRRLSSRALLMLAVAAILYFVNRTSNPAAALPLAISLAIIGLSFAFAAVVMYLSSRVAKVKIRDLIIESIPWRGDENVLDVGCGRGLLPDRRGQTGSKAARPPASIFGIPQDLSGNTAEAALANAKAEGVEKRVKIETGDARKLPFADGSFDVVLSSLALHNISYKTERTQALREIDRVLKPGGYLAIFDIFYTRQYAKLLEQLGFEDIRVSPLTLLWCVPTRSLTARKPA